MFKKIPGNAIKNSGECYQRFWGMLKKIRGMFRKVVENTINFKLIKTTFYLKKSNAKLISEARSIFAISNETIERLNKIIWYFHFFWNSNWKEIARPWGKKERKIKNQNKQKEKMNQRNKSKTWCKSGTRHPRTGTSGPWNPRLGAPLKV